jgi:predicted alpha/beta hydrolase family esterase
VPVPNIVLDTVQPAMSSLRVLILHGWQGNDPGHWQTWLADELVSAGAEVFYPDLPECDLPCPDRWGSAVHMHLRRLAKAEGERVVVCHSLGCVAWLREAVHIRPEHRVDRVALVAPPCPGAKVPELARFYPTNAQAEAVRAAARHTRLVCSDDDPYCPGRGAPAHWGRPLELVVDLLPGQGHLNVESGHGPWPEMLDWCLGRREALAYGAKNGALT